MIDTVINKINSGLEEIFNYPGIKFYGMTQSLRKEDEEGNVSVYPAVVNEEGEGIFVGVDDISPMIVYHKNLNVSLRTALGYGEENNPLTLYANQMVVFFDRSKINIPADEIHLHVMARTADRFRMRDFKSVRVIFQSVNLSSQLIYQGEYQTTDLLPLQYSMVAINYQVESIFIKSCFPVCPS